MHRDADEQEDKGGDNAKDEDDAGLSGREIATLGEGVRNGGHFILLAGILSVSKKKKKRRAKKKVDKKKKGRNNFVIKNKIRMGGRGYFQRQPPTDHR